LNLVNKVVLVAVLVEIMALAVKVILQPYLLLKVPMEVPEQVVQRLTTHHPAVAEAEEEPQEVSEIAEVEDPAVQVDKEHKVP
jgi:hypothetical protein